MPFLAPLGTSRGVDPQDDVRIELADGRTIHLRGSGNAPELRCDAEAETLVAWGLTAAAKAMQP